MFVTRQAKMNTIHAILILLVLSLTTEIMTVAAAPISVASSGSQPKEVVLRLDDNTIRNAVHEWVTNTEKEEVIATYGHISDWQTGDVTDMSYLFTHARFFNEDLSRWNTSSCTTMSYMFAFANSFRGIKGFIDEDDEFGQGPGSDATPDAYSLRNWDTSRVQSMSFMFHHATSFEGGGIVEWDVRSVTDMT